MKFGIDRVFNCSVINSQTICTMYYLSTEQKGGFALHKLIKKEEKKRVTTLNI